MRGPLRELPTIAGGSQQNYSCAQNKNAAQEAAFFILQALELGGERFNPLVQPALVTSGFVLIDDALVNHAVDDWYGVLVGRNSSIFVACIACVDDILDFGTHQGAQTHVVLTGFLRLAGALPS